jgi:site-specific DNA-methyltransferase (adenine-specific)
MEPSHEVYSKDSIHLFNDDVLNLYDHWPTPLVIVSDGAYGLRLFDGDPPTAEELPKWYEPHIREWSRKATPTTTLWFWNREIGWANVHPLLCKYGWEFVNCHTWDKGIGHIAGNANSKTLRQYPIVTEVCVQYVKKPFFKINDFDVTISEWLREEWVRTDLPLSESNKACEVKNAATRKYLTKDYLFYPPPPEIFEKMQIYANKFGKSEGKPYFSIDGVNPVSAYEWSKMRAKFYCEQGITNVWRLPPLNGKERIKITKGGKALHPNQKPLEFMERIIKVSSDENDVVWEPFGGLCTAAIASYNLARECYAAEINPKLFEASVERLKHHEQKLTRANRSDPQ